MSARNNRNLITLNPWSSLRGATSARIALGRAGGGLPTERWLEFQAAHAAARVAVHATLNVEQLAAELRTLGMDVVIAESAAACRQQFLLRPDLGRMLCDRSRYQLEQLRPLTEIDLSIVVSDGLSAVAAERHSQSLLTALLPKLQATAWRLAPLVVAQFGRVALQDEIGHLFSANMALILIGERPGLGSPDSLGAYLVYGPRRGNTDAKRNCVSNIRPEGLAIDAAADTIYYLLTEARRRQISGTAVKDERPALGSNNDCSPIERIN